GIWWCFLAAQSPVVRFRNSGSRCGLAVAGTQTVNGSRASNGQQPRQRLSSGCIVADRLLPDLPEDVDHDILRIFANPDYLEHEAEYQTVVSIIESLQSLRISGSHSLDQFNILAVFTLIQHAKPNILPNFQTHASTGDCCCLPCSPFMVLTRLN